MREYANLAAWPGDPYRTGRQLYRRPTPRLAAFTAGPPVCGSRYGPAAAATVYLPLHRTRTLTVTEQTLVFGFHAVSIDDPADGAALAPAADLDLMQARRRTAVLAGHLLDGDLAAPGRAAAGTELRGGGRPPELGVPPQAGAGHGRDVRCPARPARPALTAASVSAGRHRDWPGQFRR